MKRLSSYLGAALALLAVLLISTAGPVSAANSSGLSITPRKNYTIQPGSAITDKLTIGNLDQANELNISMRLIDFTFTDETGTPKLMLAENAPQTTWSLKPFTQAPDSIKVPAGQTRTVSYTIKIPKGQGAGSYYSAIQYSAAGSEGSNVSLSAAGVTLVFVSVPGTVSQDLTLKKLGAHQKNEDQTSGSYVFIAMQKPEEIGFTLQNNGNVAESPVGSITYKHMFGKAKTIDKVNPNSALALRGQSRLFLTCLETKEEQVKLAGSAVTSTKCKPPSLLPGRYSIDLDVFYGQNGNKTQEIIGKASFWYLPVWFLVIVTAVVVVAAYGIWRLNRRFRGGSSRGGKGFRRTAVRRKR